ncbi:MAG: TlyA family RNA methyltransferase [Terrimicrobiaceae bacterium]
MKPKERIDILLVQRGFFDSREKARRAVMAGVVSVDGRRVDKPGTPTLADTKISVIAAEKYVGRGGLKLEAALDAFAIPVKGRICLDIGASTGGFTDCLLQRGASKVHAIDVGHGQLDWKIREDPRVMVTEGLNARNLSRTDVSDAIDLTVADVSFISLTLILGPAFAVMAPGSDAVVLIKPQFELSAREVGRGGVVKDPLLRAKAAEKIRTFVESNGHQWLHVMDSPVPGREGNVEFLAHLRPQGGSPQG